VDVLIDKRELLEKARQKNLGLVMVEKDYVLGWLLSGLAHEKGLVFKGGTALSKIYFPKLWRLSEDLDFSLVQGNLLGCLNRIPPILTQLGVSSGIEFILKSHYANPDYLQLKIQYKGISDRNWIKVDVTLNDIVDTPVLRAIPREYSDYVPFKVRVESFEEIFASKLRAAVERKKCRDYFDLWKLGGMGFDAKKISEVFAKKCAVKGVVFEGFRQIFPDDLADTLGPYWQRELGRLVSPAPDLDTVLGELKTMFEFLK